MLVLDQADCSIVPKTSYIYNPNFCLSDELSNVIPHQTLFLNHEVSARFYGPGAV